MVRSSNWVSGASLALTSIVVRRDREMLLQASICRVATTVAALAGLAFATVDYEVNYSAERTSDNCKAGGHSYVLRWMNVAATVVAAIFSCLGHITANEAQYHNLQMSRKKDQLFYFFFPVRRVDCSLLLDLAILSVFPYPNVEGHLRITQHKHILGMDKWVEVCYTASELLYLGSFTRLYFFISNILRVVGYTDSHARAICNENRVRPDVILTLRALFRLRPLVMGCIFIIPTALVLAVFLRVFERPYMGFSHLDYEPYYNSLWLVTMSITTVNFAEFYPTTHFGRVLVLCCGMWAFINVSKTVVTIDQNFSMSAREERALFRIKRTRAAAELVTAALWLNHAILNPRLADVADLREKLATAAILHRAKRRAIRAAKADTPDPGRPLHTQLRRISDSLTRLEVLFDKMHKQ